jgi:DNA-binding protein YbaB
MRAGDIGEMLKVVRNHRDALDQLEEELVEGTVKGTVNDERVKVAVKGIALSAAYLDELASRWEPKSKSAASL